MSRTRSATDSSFGWCTCSQAFYRNKEKGIFELKSETNRMRTIVSSNIHASSNELVIPKLHRIPFVSIDSTTNLYWHLKVSQSTVIEFARRSEIRLLAWTARFVVPISKWLHWTECAADACRIVVAFGKPSCTVSISPQIGKISRLKSDYDVDMTDLWGVNTFQLTHFAGLLWLIWLDCRYNML